MSCHALQRLKDRYDPAASMEDLHALGDSLRLGKARRIKAEHVQPYGQTVGLEVYWPRLNVWVPCIVNPLTSVIVTVLPLISASWALDTWAHDVRNAQRRRAKGRAR